MDLNYDDCVEIVLSLLQDEVDGDVTSAMSKLTRDYTMTWMYKSPRKGNLFPRAARSDEAFVRETAAIYAIKDRAYDIRHVASANSLVMVELVESYTDPATKAIHRTPLVLVLEMDGNKVARGRHYCDPNLSLLALPKGVVNAALSQ
ncbi:hypothetical protein KKH81_00980 [Patescibacteria group bacterium]|nr:hypothetical protein [Patescibacteria group bacterium]